MDNLPEQSPTDPKEWAYADVTEDSILSSGLAADVLPFLPIEHFRQRPAMYIGSTDEFGLFQLFAEVYFWFANMVLAGAFSSLDVVLHRDGSVSITGSHPNTDRTDLWPITRPASIKALAEDVNPPTVRIDYMMGVGLHLVSLCVTNYLSQWFEISIRRDGLVDRFRWERGIYASPSPPLDLAAGDELTVHFMPDPEIFGALRLTAAPIDAFLRKIGPLLREASCSFHDQLNDKQPVSYASGNGLAHLIEYYNDRYRPVGDTIRSVSSHNDADGHRVEIEFALQFHSEPGVAILSAANMYFTHSGGVHVEGLWTGLQAAMRELQGLYYGHDLDEEDYSYGVKPYLSGPGFTAAVAVRLRRPAFGGCTRVTLENDGLQAEVARVVQMSIKEQVLRDQKIMEHLQYYG